MSNVPPSVGNLRGAVDLSSLVNRAAAPASGTATAPSTTVPLPGLVFDATDATFNDFLDLSMTVPLIVELYSPRSEPGTRFSATLQRVVTEYAGRLVLVRVDADANPQLTQAFQTQAVPTVAALIGGRPVALFSGTVDEQQLREVFDQALQLAAQNGVTGAAVVEGSPDAGTEASAEPAEETPAPLPPHHAEAYAAIEQGDYDTAIEEYKTAIAQDPRDTMAVAGLAQVGLLARLKGTAAAQIRAAAAEAPSDPQAQLLVADLDVSGGHLEDAFGRLLDLFPKLDKDAKDAVRVRLLDYFEIAGVDDPRVAKARSRLAALLY